MEELKTAAELANVDLSNLDVDTMVELTSVWGMRVVSASLILLGGVLAGKWASRAIKKIKALDETLRSFLAGFAKYAIFAVAVVTVLSQFGVQTASLITVLGAAGLAIGLALQGTLSNVAAGVMLLILRPFHVGDFISFGSTSGTVKNLSLFGTELATADNVYIYAPNSSIWNTQIQNFSRNTHRRQDIIVSISYDDDIDKAMAVLQKIVDKDDRIITTEGKEPSIKVIAMADFSINIQVRIWCNRTDYLGLRCDLHKQVKQTFDKEGINIPFPTSLVKMQSADVTPPKPAAKRRTTSKKKAA